MIATDGSPPSPISSARSAMTNGCISWRAWPDSMSRGSSNGACCRFRVFPLLSAAKYHTTCWKFSNRCKSKPNRSERIYAARECFLLFASQIRRLRFFDEAPVFIISDVFRSAPFSGLRNAATSVGYCGADRYDGATCRPRDFSRCPTCAEPACARSTDG